MLVHIPAFYLDTGETVQPEIAHLSKQGETYFLHYEGGAAITNEQNEPTGETPVATFRSTNLRYILFLAYGVKEG